MNIPGISVVMPMYNASAFLQECIDSILNQTFKDFELIIIDDGSTDNSIKIVESYADGRIRLYPSTHNYIHSLNKGMALARGKYVARMDADDMMYPERLEKEWEFMEQHPEVDVCGSGVETFGIWGRALPVCTEHKDIASAMVFQSPMFHPTVIFRAEKIRELYWESGECKLYDPQYVYAEDYALWVKLLQQGFVFANIKEPLVHYRLSESQITSVHTEEMEEKGKAIRVNMAEYVGSLLENCSDTEIRTYYASTLRMVAKGYIIKNTLLRILSNLYRRYLDLTD